MNHRRGLPLKRARFSTANPQIINPEPEESIIRFDDPDPKTHDVELIVGNQRFYCVKMTLAKQSRYFYEKFSTEWKDQSVIILEGPTCPREFGTFLEIIHGVPSLQDSNVRGILTLATLWKANVAINQCVEYLKNTSTMVTRTKFEIAMEFKIDELKEKIISEITSPDELNTIIPEDVMHLDHTLMCQIFNKNLELQGFPPRASPSSPVQSSREARRGMNCSRPVVGLRVDPFSGTPPSLSDHVYRPPTPPTRTWH